MINRKGSSKTQQRHCKRIPCQQLNEDRLEELKQFKKEATEILENARFPVHKWESNLPKLESDDMANPGKILGHNWDKQKETLELPVQWFSLEQPVMKRAILSHLGSIYGPLGIILPTTAEGKRIQISMCCEERMEHGSIADAEKPEAQLNMKTEEHNCFKKYSDRHS